MAVTVPLPITEAVLGPDDYLVIRGLRPLTRDELEQIRARLPEALRGRVLVLDHSLEVTIARPVPRAAPGHLVGQDRRGPQGGPLMRLTDREVELLLHLASGGLISASNRPGQSASAAGMRYGRLYRKLGVVNGAQAVYRAVSWGLIPPERLVSDGSSS